jgi:hypothetical protein
MRFILQEFCGDKKLKTGADLWETKNVYETVLFWARPLDPYYRIIANFAQDDISN